MASRRLIVNADDFGFSEAVTDAIVESHLNGIVTSTTLMVNMPAAQYAASMASEAPRLGIGLHVNLTEGKPIAPPDRVRNLLDEHGRFPGNAAQSKNLWRARHLLQQVEAEIDAQVRRARDLGVELTHADSHHGINKMPVVRRALTKVLLAHGIGKARTTLSRHRLARGAPLSARIEWLRLNARRAPAISVLLWNHYMFKLAGVKVPDWKATRAMGVPATKDPKSEILACIAAVPRGVSELLLHPGGYREGEEPSESRRRTWAEDSLLCNDVDVRRNIEERGIELISFRDF
jgi:predicted glycoside hydrolase/deacetylase ChbG (UPF0249 family)